MELLKIGDVQGIRPKDVLLLGGGLVGSRLAYDFGVKPHSRRIDGFDVAYQQQVFDLIESSPAQIVLVAVGQTNVNGIQHDPLIKKEAFAVNVIGIENVALACLTFAKYAVFFSSETAFGPGAKGRPILETDQPPTYMDPRLRSEYARMKAQSWWVVRQYFNDGGDGLEIGIQYPSDKGVGYAAKVVGFPMLATDAEMSPTLTPEIGPLIARAHRLGVTQQTLHCVGPATTPYEYGMALRKARDIPGEPVKVLFAEVEMMAPRPQFGVMSSEQTVAIVGKGLRDIPGQVAYLTS